MSWQVRHQGSPRSVPNLNLGQIIVGLREGLWEVTDEVMGPNDKTWLAIEAHPQLAEIAGEMEPPPPREHPDETRLDMNALIDVCLVLLIFFIMTATYAAVQKVVPVAITTDAQKGKPTVVNTRQVNTYMIRVVARKGADVNQAVIQVEDEAKVGLNKFPEVIRGWVKRTRKQEMLLDVAGVTWGTTIKIQDAAKAAGIDKIHYLTSPAKR